MYKRQTKVFGNVPYGFITLLIRFGTAGSGSVRRQYPTEPSRMVRYELDTGTRHLWKFGTTLTPVPNTSVRIYRGYLPYRTRRYDLDTGTRHSGKFGTTSVPRMGTLVTSVSGTSLYSVRPPTTAWVPVYPTEPTLENIVGFRARPLLC